MHTLYDIAAGSALLFLILLGLGRLIGWALCRFNIC